MPKPRWDTLADKFHSQGISWLCTTIFAWTGALRKRGELDGNNELMEFADRLEKATIDTIENGEMTKDLALITTIPNPVVLNSGDFIKAVAKRL